jgi:hypothetical protein
LATSDDAAHFQLLYRDNDVRVGCWVRIKSGDLAGRLATVVKMRGRCVTAQVSSKWREFQVDDVEVLPTIRSA